LYWNFHSPNQISENSNQTIGLSAPKSLFLNTYKKRRIRITKKIYSRIQKRCVFYLEKINYFNIVLRKIRGLSQNLHDFVSMKRFDYNFFFFIILIVKNEFYQILICPRNNNLNHFLNIKTNQ